MTNSPNHIVYEFDDFWLDAAKLMLYHCGVEVSLPPKVIETLLVLIENRGEIISKEDLMDRVWADTIVEESNLSQYLYRLRKILGNRKNGKPFIETYRRRGYRFNGEVQIYTNGSPATAKVPEPSHYEVEREGNVLKLVDWQKPVPIEEAANIPSAKKTFTGKIALIATVVAVALISSAIYFWYKFSPPVNPTAPPKNDLTFTRLTNGSAPMDATISPKGDYFVYHEQDGATAHLWLQQTGGSHRIEIIPPSERIISGKTFSPNGKFIYFAAQDKPDAISALYRVPTLGGTASKILDDIVSLVSFSPDGKQFVFARWNPKTNESFLITADSSGGNEKIILSQTKEQGVSVNPEWSPDGKRIAFAALKDKGEGTINALNLQTGAIEPLSPEKWDNCYRIVWTRDGMGLAFVGTKHGEATTTRRDQIYYLSLLTGESRRLTTDDNRHQPLSLGMTEAEEILAVPFNRSSQIWQMNPTGDSRTAVQITGGLADGRAGLAALPDGRIVYTARIGDNLSVWTANADGKEPKQLTYDPPFIEEARASPDGSFLVFSAQPDQRAQLFRIDTDGANLRQLTFGNSHNIDSSISPDGKWIVYASENLDAATGKYSLQKVSSTGGEPILLADMTCYTPHFSPDGKFISCVAEGDKIAVLSAENGLVVKTFEPVQFPYFNIGAKWSPDGQSLIYIARRKNFSNLWRQPINGGEPQPLTDFTSGELHNFTSSTDGLRLYVARGFQVRDVILIKNFK